MGIFDSACTSMFFPMQCEIYYAQEDQDKYGAVQKKWNLGNSLDCSLYTPKDKKNTDFEFEDQKFFKLDGFVVGRTKKDPRSSEHGSYYPMSHILITNIRGKNCSDELFFFESTETYQQKPTVFELRYCQPYIGPYSKIEYFKLVLERSDTQELNQIVSC
jgi:hypothetical protein